MEEDEIGRDEEEEDETYQSETSEVSDVSQIPPSAKPLVGLQSFRILGFCYKI